MQSRLREVTARDIAAATSLVLSACAATEPVGAWQDAGHKGFVLALEEKGGCTILIGHVGFRCRYVRTKDGISINEDFKYPGEFQPADEPMSFAYDKHTDTMVLTIGGETLKFVRVKRAAE